MRLIHVTPAIVEEASGPSYTVKRLCQTLADQGHDITLAALDWAPLTDRPPFLQTFPLGLGPRRLGRSPAMNRWLREVCSGGGVEIVHNHGMWQMNAIYPAWATAASGVPLVWSPRGCFAPWAMRHGSWFKKPFWWLVQKPALAATTCFHATAESEYHDIRRLGFKQPVCVVPNGIDLHPLVERQPHGQRTLLFLGRIHFVKGLANLLHAWSAVEPDFPDWRLKLVGGDAGYHGSDGHLESLQSLARSLGLQRVEFSGPKYGDDKFREYCNADLYVLPSFTENFAVTVAESLSMETPAIVSKGAPWSGLTGKGAGWWIDIGAEPLVHCLREALAKSPVELAEMGRRGRAWMHGEFSWPHVTQMLATVYEWLLNPARTPPSVVRMD
jgi:glycosyltransferase involved in cell wall biosynthesis